MVEVVEETPAETKTPQAFVNEEISDDATNRTIKLPALETMRNTFRKCIESSVFLVMCQLQLLLL